MDSQPFDDPTGGEEYFNNMPSDYLLWYTVPPPNLKVCRSVQEWQEKFTREEPVALTFKNRNTGDQWQWLKVCMNGSSVRFAIIGGTTFPRMLVKLALTHPQSRDRNITLRAVFPVYGDDAHGCHRDLVNVTPGQPIENGVRNSLSTDGTYTLSNGMKNFKYNKTTISQDWQAKLSGIKMGNSIEEISWSSDYAPICSRFNDDLSTVGFTLEQISAAETFRKIRGPDVSIVVRTSRQTSLDKQFRLVAAIPSPVLPPFPNVDARYNTGLKCLKPIHVSNIPSLAAANSGTVRAQYGQRQRNWEKTVGLGNSLLTAANDRRIVPIEYRPQFDNKRHYEAIQMLGLAREIHAQEPETATLFNRRYAFSLVPVPNSVDASEFLIFLNVRPTGKDRHDSQMAPPEPGTKVEIDVQLGRCPSASPPHPRQPSGPLAITQRPHASSDASQRVSSGGSIAPQQRQHASSIAPQRIPSGGSGRSSGLSSPVARPRLDSDAQMPNIDSLLLFGTPGALSTWTGPTIDRMSDQVTWNGLVVPSSQLPRDNFNICIYIRIPMAAAPMGGLTGGFRSGNFRFGVSNSGPFAQAEQAIRLAMYGDGSFYRIPPWNWMQGLLFGLENPSLRNQGRGATPPNGVTMHQTFKSNPLTPRQREALNAALSNNSPANADADRRRDQANHFAVIIKGPPGTGKTTVSQCIGYHCYMNAEKLLVTCGTNRALNNLAKKLCEILPKTNAHWTVKDSVLGVYRLETEFDESFSQIDRNAKAYQHTFQGEYEHHKESWNVKADFGIEIDDSAFARVEEYVRRRIHTGKPLSLGDHILTRLRKAKMQRVRNTWTHDLYPEDESKHEYDLLWHFLTLRNVAVRQNAHFVEILGEDQPQRQARFDGLNQIQKDLVRETSKAWRNLQAFYLKHAKIVFLTAQTAGRRTMKGFRAQRVIIEEAGQLDEPNSLNAFVRSFSTLRKVIWSGDPAQLPPTLLSYDLNEAGIYRATSQMERLIQTGLEVIELDIQFRMDPEIAKFISREFYGNRIRNDASVINTRNSQTFKNWVKAYAAQHGKTISKPSSSFFISVSGTKVYRRKQASSPCNPTYIERTHHVVMSFLEFIRKEINVPTLGQLSGQIRLAVACYYTEELSLLKKWFHEVENMAYIVDVVTVDSTQGWEWDVVVLSTTRPGGEFGLGFVSDSRRMNASLSRAKFGHVTIGFKDMGTPRDSAGNTRPVANRTHWQRYWTYHNEELQCFLEVGGGFETAARVLNVNPNDYEVITDGATRPT